MVTNYGEQRVFVWARSSFREKTFYKGMSGLAGARPGRRDSPLGQAKSVIVLRAHRTGRGGILPARPGDAP